MPTCAKENICGKKIGFENRGAAQGALKWPKMTFCNILA